MSQTEATRKGEPVLEPGPDPSAYSVETRALSLWYGDFQALRDVSIRIKRGIITGLIGPPGCGKTTLLRCFNRVNERFGNVTTKGSVWIHGKDIYEPDVSLPELRKAVGMVFQRPNPLPISIYENVIFGLRIHSGETQIQRISRGIRERTRRGLEALRGRQHRTEMDEIVEHSLREVLLWDDVKDKLRKRATTNLQLEQQQKLCIARLLPLKPRVILMDEPCSALDARGTEAIEDLMVLLRERYTIIIVTHNMAQARRASDECIYMLLGRIVEHGPTVDLFLRPQHKETEDYVEGRYG